MAITANGKAGFLPAALVSVLLLCSARYSAAAAHEAAAATTYEAGATDGSATIAVMLVEALGDVEKSWADDLASEGYGVIAMVGSDVFTGNATTVTADLTAALADIDSLAGKQPPVLGFGSYALHAVLLTYDAWPVAVAISPDLSGGLPAKEAVISEDDSGPMLLIVSDVGVNGPFVTDAETSLVSAGVHWETVRYGKTMPMFFHSDDPSYSPAVWSRAWEDVVKTFLAGALSEFMGTEDPGQDAPEGVTATIPSPYVDAEDDLEGYLAYPSDAGDDEDVKIPAIIVLPDWDGLNTYEISRVNMLAEMGYAALAADIYGLPANFTVEDRALRGGNATFWRSNPELYVQRIRAAIDHVKSLPFVNSSAIGITGYCFGGSGVVFDVLSDSDVQVEVSFHGGIAQRPTITNEGMPPYLSYQSGGADETPEDIMWLQESLDGMEGDWDITRYSQVNHGFTAWTSGRYHKRAEGRSWEAMKALFDEYLPLPAAGSSPDSPPGSPSDDSMAVAKFASFLPFMAAVVAVLLAAPIAF